MQNNALIQLSAQTHEIWVRLDWFDTSYEISDLGRVRIAGTKTIIHPHISTKLGYEVVYLRKSGKTTPFYVHRLVCSAFHPNPDRRAQVDHINTITTDNRAINLRWATARENARNIITYARLQKSLATYRETHPEFREKARVKTLELLATSDLRQHMSTGAANRWHSDVERGKQRARTSAYFCNPENRKKAREAARARMHSCMCIETRRIYESCSEASRVTGICAANIARACRTFSSGKRNAAGGLHWCYAQDS